MVELICSYKRTIFRNLETGYTIFIIKTNEKKDVVCKGYISTYSNGMPLKILGSLTNDNFGDYLSVIAVTEFSDNSQTTIDYIVNKKIPGIAKGIATKIVDIWGDNLFAFVNQPDAVNRICKQIPRINIEQANVLVSLLKEETVRREVYEYIKRYGGNYALSLKIIDEYGIAALTEIRKNPYLVGQKCGIKFEICDSIAKGNGFDYISNERLDALIYESMISIMNSGHTYATYKQIYNKIKQIIKQSAYSKDIPALALINELNRCNFIKIEQGNPNRFYLNKILQNEKNAAFHLKRLINTKYDLNYNSNYINIIEKECGINYELYQKKAFDVLKNTGVKIITGGPGTGKTTTINGIIKNYKYIEPNKKIALCAPTGRAAQRMSESTGLEAFTIHKLLNYTLFGTNESYKNESDPIDADMIIVDESSMLDISLLSIFLGAVKSGSLVIFVGDINQLPSVGPGNVLKDLIDSKKIDVYRLDAVFRQDETSNIVYNYRQIINGNSSLRSGKDFEIFYCENKDQIINKINEIVDNNYDKDNPFDMQILSPVKEDVSGVNNLNKIIQEKVNDNSCYLSYGNTKFNKNDKVIFIANNYEKGYYNGDIGIIKYVEEKSLCVDVNGNEYEISEKELSEISLAYALTIHKSQGSEFPYGIVVLPYNAGSLLNRNLLFTALSRFKNKVYLIIENDALNRCVINNSVEKRNTKLKERLNGNKYELFNIIEKTEIREF